MQRLFIRCIQSNETTWSPVNEQDTLIRGHHPDYMEDGGSPVDVSAEEANSAGLQIAVCSTSNERAVSKIVEVLILPDVPAKIRVFAGDVVPKKKPDPAIYNLAAKELNLDPSR